MIPNIWVLLASAFIPFFVAFVWFHPKVFGGDYWAKITGLTGDQKTTPVKPLKLGLSILLNFFVAFGIYSLAVHQGNVFGLVGGNAEALRAGTGAAFLAEYGNNHLSVGHGIFHSIIGLICFVLPVVGYATIFERKSSKYLFVNIGFWLISMALMGAVICRWGGIPV